MSIDHKPERHYAREITNLDDETSCLVRGWLEDVRPMGKIAFITLRDLTGLSQVVLSKKVIGDEAFNQASNTNKQSIIEVIGNVQKSRSPNVPKEILAERFVLLSQSKPPFPIDPTGRIPSSLEKRLDTRALDLRDPKVLSIFKIRHTVLRSIRKTLYNLDFVEVNTPKLIGQAAEGGANLFSLPYFDKQAYLAQSPQLYKEQLTMSLEKVFEIASYFRAEKSHTLRHVCEFTSLDVEAAFIDEFEAMDLAEVVIHNVLGDVKKQNPEELLTLGVTLSIPDRPYTRISYSKAISILNDKGKKLEWGDDLETYDLRELGRIYKEFYFLYDWPVLIKPFYIERRDHRIAKSFDLMYGYLELASGGKRVNKREELEKRLVQQNLNLEDFESHLVTFDYGMPPHSGWAIGVDRLIMVLTKQKNIREAILFPRDTKRLRP